MSGKYIGTHDFTDATVTGISDIKKYVHSFTSSTSETITHNLDDTYPIVQVYDNNKVLLGADSITINSNNQITVTFGESTTGNVVIHSANTANKHKETFTSQTSVTVTHNLNDSYPVVQIYDDNDVLIGADSVTITDSNNITVTFGESTTGTIIIHKGV